MFSQDEIDSIREYLDKTKLTKLYEYEFDDIAYCCEDDEYETITDYIEEFGVKINASWIQCGASKVAFCFYDCPNYIFKIPFAGRRLMWWNEDIEQYETDCILDFTNASLYGKIDVKDEWNYCETESLVYQYAMEYGVEDMFAETAYVCSYYGIPIYVSEYIPNSYCTNKYHPTEDSKEKSRGITCSLDNYKLAIIIDQYGYNKAMKLSQFIENYNLSDFHGDNVRYDNNGHLRLIDYSGYEEN